MAKMSTPQTSKPLSNRPPLAELDLNIPGLFSPRRHLKERMQETRARIPPDTPKRYGRHSLNRSPSSNSSTLPSGRRHTFIGEDIGAIVTSTNSCETPRTLLHEFHQRDVVQHSSASPKSNRSAFIGKDDQEAFESPRDLLTLSQLGDSSPSSASTGTRQLSGNFNFQVPSLIHYFNTPSVTSLNITTSEDDSRQSARGQSQNKQDVSVESPALTSTPKVNRAIARSNDDVPCVVSDKSPDPVSPVIKTPTVEPPKIVPIMKPNLPDRDELRTSAASALTTMSMPCCNMNSVRGSVWIRRGRHPFSRWRRSVAWIVNNHILTWLPKRSSKQESLNLTGIDVLDLGVTRVHSEPAHVLQLRTRKPTTIHNIAVTTLVEHSMWLSELNRSSRSV